MPFIWIILISILIGYAMSARLANIDIVRRKCTDSIVLGRVQKMWMLVPFLSLEKKF